MAKGSGGGGRAGRSPSAPRTVSSQPSPGEILSYRGEGAERVFMVRAPLGSGRGVVEVRAPKRVKSIPGGERFLGDMFTIPNTSSAIATARTFGAVIPRGQSPREFVRIRRR